jgi:FtsH-binding integral membrane protein
MDHMSDPNLPHGQLPPIPDGCGIMPIAENRIARGPHPELLDAIPEGYALSSAEADSARLSISTDAMEQMYRRVLSRAVALAACSLLLAAAVAESLVSNPALHEGFLVSQLQVRVIFVAQLLIAGFCGRYVEKLPIFPAAVLLFSYASFCALEFSALLNPATLAVAFLCAGLMYAATAVWAFSRNADLARPITAMLMIVAGGVILVAVNGLLRTSTFTWTLSSVAIVIFAGLISFYAQQIRDFYQDFDDDNAQGWKASVLGALLLLVNSVNVLLVASSFLNRVDDDRDSTDDLSQ